MQLRTISRLAAVTTLVLVSGGGVATLLAPSAGASAQQRITVQPDQTIEIDYPALVGSAQAQELATPSQAFDPTTCDTVTWCDTIPITIAPPTTDLTVSDYEVDIVLTWETDVVDVPANGPTTTNDLDMAIWNDPINPTAGPNQNGIVQSSTTANIPEKISLVDESGNFSLVVANSSGVNHGYHLEIAWKTQVLEKPFESLPPDFSGGGTPFIGGSSLALGGTPAPIPAPAAPAAVGGTQLPPLAVAPDTSYGSGTNSDFNGLLGNPNAVTVQPVSTKRDARPPSNLALLLWLIALPFGLTAIGGQLLMGRSRALLRI